VTLATVALGVSSLGKTTRSVMMLWIGIWIIAGAIASIPTTPSVVRAASFSRDLFEIRQHIFRLDEILIKAGETLPIVNRDVARNIIQAGEHAQSHDAPSAYAGLAGLVIVSSLVFSRKLRPE
jgi:hypothetical protein